jgi:hypothetical protein
MRHEPGEVWLLPPAAEEGGDPKDRRHVLLTPCGDGKDVGSFAYTSTQTTEARFGAARLAAISDVQSVFHPLEIERWTGVVVDGTTMERIDRALSDLFAL